MDGKFNIGNGFNVFDEWGNFVGKFTPNGGGADGCLAVIVLIFVAFIGYAFYALIRIIIEGFKACGQHKWGLAFLCFTPIWLPALVVFMAIINNNAQVQMQQTQSVQATQAVNMILSHPDQAVSIKSITRGVIIPCTNGSGGTNCDSGNELWDEFQITNNSNVDMELESVYPFGTTCETSFAIEIDGSLNSGSSVTLYCQEKATSDWCFQAYPGYQYATDLGTWCFDHKTGNFLIQKDYEAAATAEVNQGILMEFSTGPCNFDCGFSGVALLGTLENNSGRAITGLLNGAETPQGTAWCSFVSGWSSSNSLSTGQSTEFACYGYGYDITQSNSICLEVGYDDGSSDNVCKPIK
jgi:hypothetical protein